MTYGNFGAQHAQHVSWHKHVCTSASNVQYELLSTIKSLGRIVECERSVRLNIGVRGSVFFNGLAVLAAGSDPI